MRDDSLRLFCNILKSGRPLSSMATNSPSATVPTGRSASACRSRSPSGSIRSRKEKLRLSSRWNVYRCRSSLKDPSGSGKWASEGQTDYKRQLAYRCLGIRPQDVKPTPFFGAKQLRRSRQNRRDNGSDPKEGQVTTQTTTQTKCDRSVIDGSR